MKKEVIPNNDCIPALIAGRSRLSDGQRMYLIPGKTPDSLYWRLDYDFDKKTKTLSLGIYPKVSLHMARGLASAFREMVAKGQDPSQWREMIGRGTAALASAEALLASLRNGPDTFGMAAQEWFDTHKDEWVPDHAEKVMGRIKNHILPELGKRQLSSIGPQDISRVCVQVQATGTLETGKRVLQICHRIMDYAVSRGSIKLNPCVAVTEVLKTPVRKHFPAIVDLRGLAKLVRDITEYRGTSTVRNALLLTAMLMVRGGELRQARWDEFDLLAGTWKIPAVRMKRRKHWKENGPDHVVPLPPVAVEILAKMYEHQLISPNEYVFPARGRPGRCMSANTLNKALQAMGYSTKTEMTTHGFRATARTLIVEALKMPKEVAERQLAHVTDESNGEAYDRAKYLAERRLMLERWAELIERLQLVGPEGIIQPDSFKPITALDRSDVAALLRTIAEDRMCSKTKLSNSDMGHVFEIGGISK